MRVLLVSTYEQGHQPLGLAMPAAALRARGHEVRCLDLAVETPAPDHFTEAEFIGISIPMHTAARLGLALAERVRSIAPATPLAFYGLYASVVARAADRRRPRRLRDRRGVPARASGFGRSLGGRSCGGRARRRTARRRGACAAVRSRFCGGARSERAAAVGALRAAALGRVAETRRLRGGDPRLRPPLPPLPHSAGVRRTPAAGGDGGRAGRHRCPGGDGCAAPHLRRSGFPQRTAALAGDHRCAARALSGRHLRRHGESRAPAGIPRSPAAPARRRLPLPHRRL